jgi:hypothetical protein
MDPQVKPEDDWERGGHAGEWPEEESHTGREAASNLPEVMPHSMRHP